MKTPKTNKDQTQQGDVLFRRLETMPEGKAKIVARKHVVVAHGESGHSHVIDDEEAELIQIGERMLLQLGQPVTVEHEEHKPHTYPAGIYEVGRVQEYDYFQRMSRPVQD